MDARDLIALARTNLGEKNIDNVKDAVLAFHGHGVADDVTGDVEASCGHVIRVDRFIVTTNDQGFTDLVEYADTSLACAAFAESEDEYADWSDDEPETYLVRRFYANDAHPGHREVIKTGLSLEDAQAHCQRDDTHGDGWFDGYDKEA